MMITDFPKSKRFWFSLSLTILLFCLLCGLGVWQVQRLHWKTALIDSFTNQEEINNAPNFDEWDVDLRNPHPVMFFGFYRPELTVLVPADEGKLAVYMPFRSQNGVIVMMRRGLIEDGRIDSLVLDKNDGEPQTVSVVGVPVARPAIIPMMHEPHPENLKWTFLDWQRVKERFSQLPLAPYTVVVLDEAPSPTLKLERTVPKLWNEHKQYAIFWFGMAIVQLVLFSRFLLFPPRGKKVEGNDV